MVFKQLNGDIRIPGNDTGPAFHGTMMGMPPVHHYQPFYGRPMPPPAYPHDFGQGAHASSDYVHATEASYAAQSYARYTTSPQDFAEAEQSGQFWHASGYAIHRSQSFSNTPTGMPHWPMHEHTRHSIPDPYSMQNEHGPLAAYRQNMSRHKPGLYRGATVPTLLSYDSAPQDDHNASRKFS